MSNFILPIILTILLSACSIVPHKDFNVSHRNNHEDFKQINKKFVTYLPGKKVEGGDGPTYKNDFQLPLSFRSCNVDIYHEVIFSYSSKFDEFMNASPAFAIGTLGIIPYKQQLIFKTKMTLTSSHESISKETDSEKMTIRFGLIYIPMFIAGIFDSDVRLTNNITAKMYAYQISKLGEELKDFKCE